MNIIVQILKESKLLEEKNIENLVSEDKFTVQNMNFSVVDENIVLSCKGIDLPLKFNEDAICGDYTIVVKKDDEDTNLDEFTLHFSGNDGDEELIDNTVPATKIQKEDSEVKLTNEKIDNKKNIETNESEDKAETTDINKTVSATPPEIEQKEDTDDDIDESTFIGFAGGGLLYQLVAISGPNKDKVFSLEKIETVVGRDEDSEIVLPDDSVSRKHAVMQRIGIHYYLTDLNSSNGTYLNGNKINSRIRLNSSDVIEFGINTFKYLVLNPNLGTTQGNIRESNLTTAGTVIQSSGDPLKQEASKIEKVQAGKSKKPLNKKILFLFVFILLGYFGYSYYEQIEQEEKARIEAIKQEQIRKEEEERRLEEERLAEQAPACIEDGLCHLSIAVQKQLVAEHSIGVKLFQAERYELAEDRANQILQKAPDWEKALELSSVAKKAKEKQLKEQKKEEEAYIRRQLEKKKQKFLDEAKRFFKKKDYLSTREMLGEVFQIDPENKEAKKMADIMDQVDALKKQRAEHQRMIQREYYNARNIFDKANGYFKKQEFRKAIPVFKKCSNIATHRYNRLINIRNTCKKRYKESQKLLKEMVIPELATADQLLSEGQYTQAIESYKRILKIDYKNKNAKAGFKLAKKSLTAKARDYYSRGAIAESVSDYKTACLNYNTVLEFAMKGSKYYNMSLDKVKRYCSGY